MVVIFWSPTPRWSCDPQTVGAGQTWHSCSLDSAGITSDPTATDSFLHAASSPHSGDWSCGLHLNIEAVHVVVALHVGHILVIAVLSFSDMTPSEYVYIIVYMQLYVYILQLQFSRPSCSGQQRVRVYSCWPLQPENCIIICKHTVVHRR